MEKRYIITEQIYPVHFLSTCDVEHTTKIANNKKELKAIVTEMYGKAKNRFKFNDDDVTTTDNIGDMDNPPLEEMLDKEDVFCISVDTDNVYWNISWEIEK